MLTKLTMVSFRVCGVRHTEFVQVLVQPDGRVSLTAAEWRRLLAKYVPQGFCFGFGV